MNCAFIMTNISNVDSNASEPLTGGKSNRVAQQLIAESKLKQEELEEALAHHDPNAISLPLYLVRLGLVSENDLAQTLSRVLTLPLLEEKDFPEVTVNHYNLAIKFLKESNIVPVQEKETCIVLAMADPGDTFAIQAVELASDKTVEPCVATISQIEKNINKLYGTGQSSLADIVEEIESDDEIKGIDNIEKLKDLAGEAPVVRLVNLIIDSAIDLRASDIHIEPFENYLKVRYRVDGVLQDAEAPPARSAAAVISRVKIIAKMDIA